MKKDDKDMFPPNNVVDGVSGPKVRKKSSHLSDSITDTPEHDNDNEDRHISTTDDIDLSTFNPDNISNPISNNDSDENASAKDADVENVKVDNVSDISDYKDNIDDDFEEDEDSKDNDCDLNDCFYENNCGSCNLDLAVLNEIGKMCQTAMNNISYLVKSICNSDMRKELVAMYSQYSNILFQTNQHFEQYGEVPDCVSISCKVMGFCGIKMNTLKNKSSSHIADIMIQGTLMGVIKCQKILNRQLNIEKSTLNLLKDFNKFQRDNIDKLNAYL